MSLGEEQVLVEVAYALPDRQVMLSLHVAKGTTVEQAIRQSGITIRFPEIDLGRQSVGIFGKVVGLTHVLQAGDRVEIYRGLINDPKLARRKRALNTKGLP